jgi:hypothetical protein
MWAIFGNAVSSEKFSSNFNDIAGAATATPDLNVIATGALATSATARGSTGAHESTVRSRGQFVRAAALPNEEDVFRP